MALPNYEENEKDLFNTAVENLNRASRSRKPQDIVLVGIGFAILQLARVIKDKNV